MEQPNKSGMSQVKCDFLARFVGRKLVEQLQQEYNIDIFNVHTEFLKRRIK